MDDSLGKELSQRTKQERAEGAKTIEEKLARMYSSSNYERMGGGTPSRAGAVGVLATNERFPSQALKIFPPPNGCLIGTGNGAIWSMLELFPQGQAPKGVISIDRDPAIILSGKLVVELGKRNISKKEAVAYFFGDYFPIWRGGRKDFLEHPFDDICKRVLQKIFTSSSPYWKIVTKKISNGLFF